MSLRMGVPAASEAARIGKTRMEAIKGRRAHQREKLMSVATKSKLGAEIRFMTANR